MKLHFGFYATYIKDYPGLKHLVDIPVEAVLPWIKKIFGKDCSLMGSKI